MWLASQYSWQPVPIHYIILFTHLILLIKQFIKFKLFFLCLVFEFDMIYLLSKKGVTEPR